MYITEYITEHIIGGPVSPPLLIYRCLSSHISLSASSLSALFSSLSIQLNPSFIGLPKQVSVRSVSI